MNIELKNINDLIPADYNPRKIAKIDYERLKRSIEEFGYIEPIIWNKTSGRVIGGHQRLKVLAELGQKEIECVVVDFNEEQEKALNIALNKISGTWDKDKLFGILGELEEQNFDISVTGFKFSQLEDYNFSSLDVDLFHSPQDKTFDRYRFNEYDETRVAGYYDFPTIKACHVIPDDLISFNYVRKAKDFNVGVHFFINDYQFESLWSSPYKHFERLKKFKCVFMPDYSTYYDMPMAMKIWNLYRMRMMSQMMQDAGMNVIPIIRYFGGDTISWCMEGIEPGGVVAVSTIGIKTSEQYIIDYWKKGVTRGIEILKPECVLCYGPELDYDFKVPVKYFAQQQYK